ncbi:MAG: CDP-glucose 4,6-dehydratase [Treponema sp.]|nr:CDP-glucose 4,6-dehydratase [Treponema sp.]
MRQAARGVRRMIDLSYFFGKRVFITGHNGFTGAWLCHVLLHAGGEITGYSLENQALENSLFLQTGLENNVHTITGDIREKEKLIKAAEETKPDIVFHLAAQPLVRLSYREPVETYEVNVMGTVNLLEAARHSPSVQSVVNVTTDKVYENKEWCWGYRENENLCGLDPYSNSKSCSELVTYSYRKSFFSPDKPPAISTARSGNVLGGGDCAEDRLIPDCVRAAKTGKEIALRNPHPVRPYLHILDCIAGYLTLAEKQCNNTTVAGEYNFGPDEENCVASGTLAQFFCDAWGENIRWITESEANAPREANFLKLDSTKAKTALGWKPLLGIKTAIEKVVEYEKCRSGFERISCIEGQIKEYFG